MSAPRPALPEFPRLKLGCRFSLQEFQAGMAWVIENPATGKFFRLGLREERFLRPLDGKRSLVELLEEAQSERAAESLSPQDILQLLQSLQSAGLLEEAEGRPVSSPRRSPFLNPMFLKVPIGNPNEIFTAIDRLLKPLPVQVLAFVLVGLSISAAYVVVSDFNRFLTTMGSVISLANVPAFAVCFVILKLIHETAHGVACRRFGGNVPEAGLFFVFFFPLTYVDATSCWRFPSKWVRIFVSSAGVIAEMAVASVAALIWANTASGPVNTLAANVVVAASVTAILFNANPLMRFDGYYILADYSGRPNLYSQATRAAVAWLGKVVLGLPPSDKPVPGWVVFYGLSCIAWRILLVTGICVGAVALLHGIGLLLSILTILAFYLPVVRKIPSQVRGLREQKFRPSAIRIGVIILVVVMSIFVPLLPPPAAPGVVESGESATVRVQCPGFVQKVKIHSGQEVKAGDVLLVLKNPEEELRVQKLKTEALRSEALAHALREESDLHRMAQQLEKVSALRQQVNQVRAYVQTLSIRSPQSGTVFGRRLDHLEGRYVSTGTELFTIGSADDLELRIAISHEQFGRLRPQVGDVVEVFFPGRLTSYPAEVSSIESRATTEIRHDALAAPGGGPLPVHSIDGNGGEGSYVLVNPHFYIRARLFPQERMSGRLRPGESVRVRFPSGERRTLFASLLESGRTFIRTAADRVGHASGGGL